MPLALRSAPARPAGRRDPGPPVRHCRRSTPPRSACPSSLMPCVGRPPPPRPPRLRVGTGQRAHAEVGGVGGMLPRREQAQRSGRTATLSGPVHPCQPHPAAARQGIPTRPTHPQWGCRGGCTSPPWRGLCPSPPPSPTRPQTAGRAPASLSPARCRLPPEWGAAGQGLRRGL